MSTSTSTYTILTKKLARYRRREKRIHLLTGLLRFLWTAIPFVLLVSALEVLTQPEPGTRMIFTVVLAAGIFASLSIFVFPPLFRLFFQPHSPSLLSIALKVGPNYQNVNDRLANALEIFQNAERDRERYSMPLIEASLDEMRDSVIDEDFAGKVSTAGLKKTSRYAALSITGCMLLWALFLPAFSSLHRILHPYTDYTSTKNITFNVSPGSANVLKGNSLKVAAWVSDSTSKEIQLTISRKDREQNYPLTRSRDDTFRYQVENIKESFDYYLSVAEQQSELYTISVIERPLLRLLQLKIVPPSYAQMDPILMEENVGDINALKGSGVHLTGQANKNIANAELIFEHRDILQLRINKDRLSGNFKIWRDDTYHLNLTDEHAIHNESPIEYHIRVLADQKPFVRIVSPGRDTDLGEGMIVPLAIDAQDDYGISRLRLAFQILLEGKDKIDSTAFAFQDIQGFNANQEHVEVAFDWDLSQSDLLPGDEVVYYVEAYDNDTVSGPKRAQTKMYRARFPSLYEMYQDMTQNQDTAINEIEEAYKKSRELQERVEKINRKLKRDQELDWEKKQQIAEIRKQQQDIEEHLQKVADNMEQILEKSEKDQLLSPETLEKYEKLQDMFREIMTPELEDAMKKMGEAMKNLDQNLVKKAMEDFKLYEEDFNKSLDRTMALLKRLKVEQNLDQAAKMAKDLANRQEHIKERAAKENVDKERLAREQERIEEDSKALSELLKELQQDMAEDLTMPKKQVDQARAEMESKSLQQKLTDLKQMLQQRKMGQMSETSTQTQQQFQRVANQLDIARQMMSGEMAQKTMRAMQRSSQQLLELSKRQEELVNQTRNLAKNSPQYQNKAQKQQETAAALERVMNEMYNASKQSMGMDPRISQSMGQARQKMDQALKQMEERNSAQASAHQQQAMAQLNQAVKQIQNSMNNMQQQGRGGGMSYQQMLQHMQQMSQSQQQINQQTMGLSQEGQLSLGQQAAMSRLASQQQSVRKSMQQLAKEAGDMDEILGSLDKIAEDMEKVEKDFLENKITRETIQRQNKILSRMLDAQKSVREREYSRKRRAETAEDYAIKRPDELPEDLGERINALQRTLLQAKKEGYSRDYLKLIEDYFKALSEYEKAN